MCCLSRLDSDTDSDTEACAPGTSAVVDVDAPNSQDIQSPMARWFAEPVSFELIEAGEDQCCWQAVHASSQLDFSRISVSEPVLTPFARAVATNLCDPSIDVRPLAAMAPLEHPSIQIQSDVRASVASTSAPSSPCAIVASDHEISSTADCDASCLTPSPGKLSASAARRRRRQKAATFSAKAMVAPEEHRTSEEISRFDRVAQGFETRRTFGQRRCGELSSQLVRGGEELADALREIRGSVRRLSFESHGCRLVQDALLYAEHRSAASLAAELQGYVRMAIESPNGNFVVQKIVEVLPVPLAEFVAEELLGHAAETARHRYGCRVLCRLVEHAGLGPSTAALIDEILAAASDLCMHVYGHYVIECVLEHGHPAQKRRIARALSYDLSRYTRDRNSTYVLKAALAQCSPTDVEALADALASDVPEMLKLASDQFGHHVVRALLRSPAESSKARDVLQRWAPQLQEGPYGRRVLDEMMQDRLVGRHDGQWQSRAPDMH